MTDILMPALSPTMEEGTLAKWLVKEGDVVKSGDILAEIETDKATMEFEAVDEGTIGKLLVAEGTQGVKVNTPIATLAGEGEEAAQALFDAYVSALDHALRELGVGDVSVGKKMRKLGEALYGRMKAYEGPLRAGDVTVLAGALARNVYETENADAARFLAQYALDARAGLSTQGLKAIKSGPKWPDIHP